MVRLQRNLTKGGFVFYWCGVESFASQHLSQFSDTTLLDPRWGLWVTWKVSTQDWICCFWNGSSLRFIWSFHWWRFTHSCEKLFFFLLVSVRWKFFSVLGATHRSLSCLFIWGYSHYNSSLLQSRRISKSAWMGSCKLT